ncbi:MAG: aldehyde dehydrogenase family protein [Bacteroidota bacterium]
MEKEEIGIILEKQKQFFKSGKTLDLNYRSDILKKLRLQIIENEQEIKDALWKDFHKPGCEVLSSEIQFVLKELNLAIRKLRKWARPRRVKTPIVHFIASSYVFLQPYGQVLVLSPWNFPFQLSLVPVLSALAAGNCVVLKTSQRVPFTSGIIEKILSRLPDELVVTINGDHSISEYLLDYKFDYIFFTGSTTVGKYVMGKAAANMIPVSLELGGKSPCIVAADAKLDFAAKRIAWGKFYNAGQTCVAPDYIVADIKIRDELLALLAREIKSFYGENPQQSDDLPRVINSQSVQRLASLMNEGRLVIGGTCDEKDGYVAPTIIRDIRPDDHIMQQEIFGPVLPVIDFKEFNEVYSIIERNPNPLAVYIFTRNKKLAREFLMRTKSGSAAINDTVIQFASPYLPFGGVGSSGMGRYHGKSSFETFSNERGVMVKSNLIDLFLRYPPYSKLKEKAFKLFMR